MIESDTLAILSVVWVALAMAAVVLRMRRGSASSGLLLAWVLNLFIINGLPGAMLAFGGARHTGGALLEEGMLPAVAAIASAFAGVVLAEVLGARGASPGTRTTVEIALEQSRQEAWLLVGLGTACFLVLQGMPRLPTITALLIAGLTLLPLGLGLLVSAGGAPAGGRRALALLGISSIPIATTVFQGYLGYGIAMVSVAGSVAVAGAERRLRAVLVLLASGYIALSFFVSYSEGRDDLRSVVWSGGGISERTDRFLRMVTATRPFKLGGEREQEAVMGRLDQVSMVGLAKANLDLGAVDYARGETVRDAFLALVPRALWPEKPFSAGSGDIVSRFTGLSFQGATSVGATQLLESFVNFGYAGVIVFFFGSGLFLAAADRRGGAARAHGDFGGFLAATLPASAFVGVGGSFVELSVGVGAGFGIAWLLRRSNVLPRVHWSTRRPASSDAEKRQEQMENTVW